MHQGRRVVVTGLGIICPLGNEVKTAWANLLAGKSGIAPIDTFDVSEFPSRIAGLVRGFDPNHYLSPKDSRRMDVFVQYGIAAAMQAIQDAGLSSSENANRIGVSIGSGIGGLEYIERNHETLLSSGPKRISPFFIPGAIVNMIAGYVSILHGYRGPNIAFATACTTGCHSIGMAARSIAYDEADVMIAGGAEKASTPLGMGGFCATRALSTRNEAPEEASRPWDRDRDGFVLGDGAGVLVLESYEHAKKRGAQIYAELAGFGMSASATHITQTSEGGEGEAAAMTQALQDAAVPKDAVDYINAHGTSTPIGDVAECLAIQVALKEHAKRVAISSSKSMTGHLLGAAGAIEAVFSVLAIQDQVAPPTINLHNPDPACHLDFIPHQAREMLIQVCLSNSFGFGGTNGALVFKRL